jgi:hypothetical protein
LLRHERRESPLDVARAAGLRHREPQALCVRVGLHLRQLRYGIRAIGVQQEPDERGFGSELVQ